MIQRIKDYLVSLGPRNPMVRLSLKLHCQRNGFALSFPDTRISVRQGHREIVLAEKDFYLVPNIVQVFEQAFGDIEPKPRGDMAVLDFSGPGTHRYKRHGIALAFPGFAEDDSIEAYTLRYKPKPGDLVLDIGAHAGFTTCMFARMVGPGGRVVAFEPDTNSLKFLETNVHEQGISNVTIVGKAIDSKTGTAYFNADGTMGAGLVDHSMYASTGHHIAVETLSLEDACREFGMPHFVKMDIEGAELAVVESASEFLKAHSIHLAFDSYHRLHGKNVSASALRPDPSKRAIHVDAARTDVERAWI